MVRLSSIRASAFRPRFIRGYSQLATFVSVDNNTNGTPRTATYQVSAPHAAWGFADNGTYTIGLQPNQVCDTSYNYAVSGAIGTFSVQCVSTWYGSGSDANWSTAANWGGTPVAAYDDLVFAGSGVSNNDLAAGTQFGNLTFNAGSGAFTLKGNSVHLTGDLTDNSTSTQTINLPITHLNGIVVAAGKLIVANSSVLPNGSNLTVGANTAQVFGAIASAAAPAASPAITATIASPATSAGTSQPTRVAPEGSRSPSASELAVAAWPKAFAAQSAATGAQIASVRDKAIQAAIVKHYAWKPAWPVSWTNALNSDNPQDKSTLAIQALDAALAGYGQE